MNYKSPSSGIFYASYFSDNQFLCKASTIPYPQQKFTSPNLTFFGPFQLSSEYLLSVVPSKKHFMKLGCYPFYLFYFFKKR
jgi:hypothetical protein